MPKVRERIVAYALWGVANEPQIHYRQVRPIDNLDSPYTLPTWVDCSGFVTCAYKPAGASDPNGNDYNGDGFTGTLLAHLEHIDRTELQAGDLIVFGPGSGDHVVVVVQAGANPLLVSHGTEGGPAQLTLSQEASYHRQPVTFLRGAGLDQPDPTPSPPEDDDMQHAYFVQHDGASATDPVWLASTTFDPIPVDNFDVAHVVAFCTGVTIHPVPDVAKRGAATRAGKTETTWLLDAAGAKYFHL